MGPSGFYEVRTYAVDEDSQGGGEKNVVENQTQMVPWCEGPRRGHRDFALRSSFLLLKTKHQEATLL